MYYITETNLHPDYNVGNSKTIYKVVCTVNPYAVKFL